MASGTIKQIKKTPEYVTMGYLSSNGTFSVSDYDRAMVSGIYNASNGFSLMAQSNQVYFLNPLSGITASAVGGVLTITNSTTMGFRLLIIKPI